MIDSKSLPAQMKTDQNFANFHQNAVKIMLNPSRQISEVNFFHDSDSSTVAAHSENRPCCLIS